MVRPPSSLCANSPSGRMVRTSRDARGHPSSDVVAVGDSGAVNANMETGRCRGEGTPSSARETEGESVACMW